MSDENNYDKVIPLSSLQNDNTGEDSQAYGSFLIDQFSPGGEVEREASETNKSAKNSSQNELALRGESVQQRVYKVRHAKKPLMEAAQPLLRALSDMPSDISNIENVEFFKKALIAEIDLFNVVCDEVNISWKKMAVVRYCICTALDEAAHATSWGMMAGWSQSNLLNHFEGDNDGGNKFFLLVGRLSMNPKEYSDVLEVLLIILGLGFEGRYSIIEDGDRQLLKIRQRLLALIQSINDAVPTKLSPHALVEIKEEKKRWQGISFFTMSLFLSTLMIIVFLCCKYFLFIREGDIYARLHDLSNLTLAATTPEKTRLDLPGLLKKYIDEGLVTVDDSHMPDKIVFRSDSMFLVGSAEIRSDMIAVLKNVANDIKRVKANLLIVGHTDSTPIHHIGLENNQILSEKRAENVAHLFLEEGTPQDRIEIKGAGDSQPISNNDDPAGRALNRRVEIFVTY
ncbi:type IVB secretion system protein IcmH/DotU [Erwinia amylovora]